MIVVAGKTFFAGGTVKKTGTRSSGTIQKVSGSFSKLDASSSTKDSYTITLPMSPELIIFYSFEKLCYGLNVTPDELLLPKDAFYHFSCRFTPSAPLPFSENLSASLRRICREKGLSCALASEYCDICSEYFGRIVRGKVSPTILTLEKLCLGLDAAPNQLLLPLE